jgi:hypothetical protein
MEKIMLVPLSKRNDPLSTAPPLDFHRFRHREEKVFIPKKRAVVARPLWIVGISPFDPVIADHSGHVVHLGEPRFTARWTMNPEVIAQVREQSFHDEDLGIVLYEALSAEGPDTPPDAWLLEAACAVAYAKGLIAAIDPEEMH